MWFVFSLSGISTITQCKENVVSFEETCVVKSEVLERSIRYSGNAGCESTQRIRWRRLKAIWQPEPRPGVNRFNWAFEEQVFAAPVHGKN